ncbi:MAG: YIP1 family protein [Bacteroidales bacterium]|jgi:hypothetical protein|nr:YIP1 family protein [Bacteroidales bacterium]
MKSLKVLYNPQNVYEEISVNNSWGLDYIFLSLLLVSIAILMIPINEQILQNHEIMKSFSSVQIDMINSMQKKIKYLATISEPISLLIRSLCFSSLLYIGVLLFKYKVKFGELFCLVVISYSIVILSKVVNLIIFYFKGYESVVSMFDVNPISLSTFFSVNGIGVPLYNFFSVINVFQVWFIIIIIYGVANIVKITKKKASIIVISSWIIITLFNVFRATTSYDLMQHS